MSDRIKNTESTRQQSSRERTSRDLSGASPAPLLPDAAALRAIDSPADLSPRHALALQRVAGNRAVSGLIQAKLTVGAANDRYEQEADRVAEQVTSGNPQVASGEQRAVQRQGEEPGGEVQTKPLAASITPLVQRSQMEEDLQAKRLPSAALGTRVQRQMDEEEIQTKPLVQRQMDEEEIQTKPLVQRQMDEEEIQTKPLVQRQMDEEEIQTKPLVQRQMDEPAGEIQTKPLAASITPLVQRSQMEEELQAKPLAQRQPDGGFNAGGDIESRLAGQKGGGSPLPAGVRHFIEPRLGADLSNVRIHTDPEASRLSRAIDAQAFTHGSNIYMGEGRYHPGTTAGNRLLAHELVHVVQQGAAPVSAVQAKSAPRGPKPLPVTKMIARKELVQRIVVPTTGVHRDWNLAEKQASLDGTLGFCPPMINGVQGTSADKTFNALAKPQIDVKPGDHLQFEAQVLSEPINIAGWEMWLPKAGPWKQDGADKHTMTSYSGVRPKNTKGTITLAVDGVPNHGTLARQIETHENVHAADNMRIINTTLGAWDAKIKTAREGNMKFSGPTATLAEEALYHYLGGTPREIADRLDAQWGQASDDYHRTAQGRTIAENPRLQEWRNRLTLIFRLTSLG